MYSNLQLLLSKPALVLRRGFNMDLFVSLFSDSSGGSERGLDVAVSGLDGMLVSPKVMISFIHIAIALLNTHLRP
jgi:hypothetical protein